MTPRPEDLWSPWPDIANSAIRHYIAASQPWYHLTDNPDFALDPEYNPANNTTLGGDWPNKGLFVAQDPGNWYHGHDYVRPFVAELEGEAENVGGYGGEHFVHADQFPNTQVKRVIPYTAWEAERYDNQPYTGPDVRQMSPEERAQHFDATNQYIRDARAHMLSYPCENCGENATYNQCEYCDKVADPTRDKYQHRAYLPQFKGTGDFYTRHKQGFVSASQPRDSNLGHIYTRPFEPGTTRDSNWQSRAWTAAAQTYYHTAPQSARESIQTNGLPHGSFITTDPDVYKHMFSEIRANEGPFDVWHVDASDIPTEPDVEGGAPEDDHIINAPIGPERLRLLTDEHTSSWMPEGWDAPEPYSPQGDRCPMCKNHRLITMPSDTPQTPDSLICPECNWAGERAPDWMRESAANGPTMYHVTHRDNVDSILQHGIDYSQGQTPWDTGQPIEPGNYMYSDLDEAHDYGHDRQLESSWGGPSQYAVIEFDASGLPITSDPETPPTQPYHPDQHDTTLRWYTPEPISPDRITNVHYPESRTAATALAHPVLPPPHKAFLTRMRHANLPDTQGNLPDNGVNEPATQPEFNPPSPHILNWRPSDGPGRGIVEPNGRIYTWPEDWGTHADYALTHDMPMTGWAPFYLDHDRATGQTRAFGSAMNHVPIAQHITNTLGLPTQPVRYSHVHSHVKSPYISSQCTCQHGQGRRVDRSPCCRFCDRGGQLGPKMSTQGSSRTSTGPIDGIPSEQELSPYLDNQECYLAAEALEQQWPHLKADAGFYVHPRQGPGDHAWNIASDGTIVDVTASQFGKQPTVVSPTSPRYRRYVSWTRHPEQAQIISHDRGEHVPEMSGRVDICPKCQLGTQARNGDPLQNLRYSAGPMNEDSPYPRYMFHHTESDPSLIDEQGLLADSGHQGYGFEYDGTRFAEPGVYMAPEEHMGQWQGPYGATYRIDTHKLDPKLLEQDMNAHGAWVYRGDVPNHAIENWGFGDGDDEEPRLGSHTAGPMPDGTDAGSFRHHLDAISDLAWQHEPDWDQVYEGADHDWCGSASQAVANHLQQQGVPAQQERGGLRGAAHAWVRLGDGTIVDPTIHQYIDRTEDRLVDPNEVPEWHGDVAIVPAGHPFAENYSPDRRQAGLVNLKMAGPATAPPNYRKGGKEGSCAGCKMFDKGKCWGYGNTEVEPEMVCDSFDPETRDQYKQAAAGPLSDNQEEIRGEGTPAHFEYHCFEDPSSSDAELWYRSHQPVTVLGLHPDSEDPIAPTRKERIDYAMPLTYKVRFPDGFEGDAMEDELLDGPHEYTRHDPPQRTSATKLTFFLRDVRELEPEGKYVLTHPQIMRAMQGPNARNWWKDVSAHPSEHFRQFTYSGQDDQGRHVLDFGAGGGMGRAVRYSPQQVQGWVDQGLLSHDVDPGPGVIEDLAQDARMSATSDIPEGAPDCPKCGATDEYQGGLCYSCGYGSKPCPRCGHETDDDGHCWNCNMTVPAEVSQKEHGKPQCQNCGSTDLSGSDYPYPLYQCRDCNSYTRLPGEGLNVERDIKMPIYNQEFDYGPVRQGAAPRTLTCPNCHNVFQYDRTQHESQVDCPFCQHRVLDSWICPKPGCHMDNFSDAVSCGNCLTPNPLNQNTVPTSMQDPLEEQFRMPSGLQWDDKRNSSVTEHPNSGQEAQS